MAYFWFTSEENRATTAKNMRERLQKIRDSIANLRRAFGVVWGAHRPSSATMAICSLIGAALPAAQAWIGKLIVDTVVQSINSGTGAQAGLMAALPWLIAERATRDARSRSTIVSAGMSTGCSSSV